MKLAFDISTTEFVIVRDILADIVPPGCRVWVFGSRAKNQARFNSDLDLALECKDKLPPIILHKLKEAFSDSPLPYRVDVLDINDVSENFQTIIRQQAIAFPLAKSDKVPALRFPEFRDAERGWENELFEKVYSFKVTNSLSRNKLNYENGSVKNIHYGDIHTKFSALFNIQSEIVPFINSSESLEKIKQECYCKEGDMIFADASEDLDDVGKSIEIISLNNEKLLSGLHTLLARQKENMLKVGFGGYLFQSTRIREQIKKESQGAKVLGISAGRLSGINVSYPSDKKEQKKIAAFLSSVDTKIEQTTRKKALMEQYKKGMMQKLFSRELRFKDAQGNDFPDWVEKRLGEVANVYQPETLSQKQLEEDGKYLVYGANGVIGRLNKFNHEHPQVAVACRGNTCGRVTFTNAKSWITGNAMVVNLDDSKEASKRFIYNLFIHTDWTYLITGSGQPQITGEIKKHKLFLPSLPEQQKIADFLSSIDRKIDLIATKLTQAQTFKKGMMQQMFI